MDQELKAFLEERESRMEARMDERFARLEAHMDERFARVDERFARVDERFARVDERFEKVETDGHQTRILMEGMNDHIRMLAEGLMSVSERLESHQAETARGFEEVKNMLSPYYRELNGRAQGLEADVRSLDLRLKVLEGRASRQTDDVLDAIRKKFSKPQSQ